MSLGRFLFQLASIALIYLSVAFGIFANEAEIDGEYGFILYSLLAIIFILPLWGTTLALVENGKSVSLVKSYIAPMILTYIVSLLIQPQL